MLADDPVSTSTEVALVKIVIELAGLEHQPSVAAYVLLQLDCDIPVTVKLAVEFVGVIRTTYELTGELLFPELLLPEPELLFPEPELPAMVPFHVDG